ncbi:6-phosphogluconolactonase [Nocardioides panacisoli]|uniref:6-phosphogluconolactonase n=1 Tax=Nocardioides panacisoli TaxID=627624 RepID=UPI001C636636|nr:6-phosphogluconolactonase [Nocardioides panacisoli]QYJ04973.1 6-phosphogluconolactonase [Nocardioides panacisoli]
MTGQRPESRIEIHPDADSLATAVAGALHGRLSRMEAAGRAPNLVLTGGTVAGLVHAEIARHHSPAMPDVRPVDWSAVSLWWGDERFVDADSEDRNAVQARRDFLDDVGATRVHEVPAAGQAPDVQAAAAAYAETLAAHRPDLFDIVMLGVGPDGHVASLFPHHAALTEHDRSTVAVTDSPKPPPERVSLTLPALNRARSVWFLVSGSEKAEAVARALAAEGSAEETPARSVRGVEETIWFLDAGAASQL